MHTVASRGDERLPPNWRGAAGRLAPYALGAAVAAVLVIPFAVAEHAWFEWANSYWLLGEQTAHVRATGRPTYFLNTDLTGVGYPFFVFYGGFTLTALAYVAVATSPWFAFVASLCLAFFAAYVGTYWTARAVGTGRIVAGALAVVAAATPYLVTDVYGRGAWAELLGVAASYLLLGATLRGLRELSREQSRPSTSATIVTAAALLAGTHNISLVLGVAFVVVGVAALAPWCRHLRRSDWWPILTRITGPAAIGGGLAAAWLVPNVWLSPDTTIASRPDTYPASGIDSWSTVLSPVLRLSTPPASSPNRVFNQACSLVLVVVIACLVTAWRRGALRRFDQADRWRLVGGVVLAVATVVAFVATVASAWWLRVESLARLVQFPMRINPYLSGFLVLGAILGAVVVAPTRRHGPAVTMLAVAVAVWYLGLAVFQAATAEALPVLDSTIDHHAIDGGAVPPAFSPDDYQVVQFRLTGAGKLVERPPAEVAFDADGQVQSEPPRGPGPFATNVVWSPLVTVRGASIIGRDASGLAVITVATPGNGEPLVVETRHPAPVVVGIGLSIASAALLVIGSIRRAGSGWSRRRRVPEPRLVRASAARRASPPSGDRGRPSS